MPLPQTTNASASSSVLSVSAGVADLIVLFQLEREMLRYESAWLAGVPYWDAKQMVGQHILEDAEHAEALLKRLHELKASAAEHKQTPGVENLLREFASCSSGDEWLNGLYRVLKPWVAEQMRAYIRTGDPLMDAPSHQAIHRILSEIDAQIAWFSTFTPQYSAWEQKDVREWLSYAEALTKRARVADGKVTGLETDAPARPAGRPDFTVLAVPRRDRTFSTTASRDPKYSSDQTDFEGKRFAIFYNHSQEIQFAESLGAVLFETTEMPWAYHHDIARHIADEVRHARMGQVRLEQMGHRFLDQPMMTQHYGFRSKLEPFERFCLMTLVMEASSFEHKRANISMFDSNGDSVSSRYAEYDVRDEMLHANLGHVWVPILLRVYHDSRSVAETVEHCRGLIAQTSSDYLTKESAVRKAKP